MSREVKVYWKEDCNPCTLTKNWLGKKGIDYEAIEVTDEIIREKNLMQVPYVEVTEYSSSGGSITDHWTDFKIDKLRGLLV